MGKWERCLCLNVPGAGEEGRNAFPLLLSLYTQPQVLESLQGCILNNHNFSCLLYSVILSSFHQEEAKVLLAGMSHYCKWGLGKIYHWLKRCRGKANLTHHRFLNLSEFLCEGLQVKILLCFFKSFSSLPKSILKPHFYYPTCGLFFFFWLLLSILPNSRHYTMRKYWE